MMLFILLWIIALLEETDELVVNTDKVDKSLV